MQIGNAGGGFVSVAKETKRMTNVVEAHIKVSYNYSGLIPSSICIKDEKGNNFIVQTVTSFVSRWLIERDVQIHGSFKRQAAIDFNEYDPKA